MTFTEIARILSAYSFDYKVRICQQQSLNIMSINGLKSYNELINAIMPWEVETLALFLLDGDEQAITNGQMSMCDFNEIMSFIRNYEHPKLTMGHKNGNFAEVFMITAGLTQFRLQENTYFKSYRYKFFFNFMNEKVDMRDEFVKKFGCKYDDVERLSFFFNLIFCYYDENGTRPNAQPILSYLYDKYRDIFKLFVISRNELTQLQNQVMENFDSYLYGFRYYYQYPFIEYNNSIHMPLPHLIREAMSSSLLFRLTENNNSLREKFGKEVLEEYLLDIIGSDVNLSEIYPEFVYNIKGNLKTLDVLTRIDETVILYDSKAFSPKVSLRDLDDKEIEESSFRIAKSVKQVYQHVTRKFNKVYNPFSEGIEINSSNVFGIVVIAEDNYVNRRRIYTDAAETLEIDTESEEYKFLCSNIKILSLYSVEEIFFFNQSIVKLLVANQKNPDKWYDLQLTGSFDTKKVLNLKITETEKRIKKLYSSIVEEMKNKKFSVSHL